MKIALVGNQNSGKTLLFNHLTGLNQKVGNWAGVTVERKEGTIKKTGIQIVDLPGIYSLSPYTAEEEISRNFIVTEDPDVIVNIIDSTSIERSLYLTTQLLELGKKVIVVLNMEDILKKRGYTIDISKLSKLLHTTVVSISALKKTGITNLIDIIKNDRIDDYVENKIYDKDVESLIDFISIRLPNEVKEKRFAAVKIIERDERYEQYSNQEIEQKIQELESKHDDYSEAVIANQRYVFIETLRDKCVLKTYKKSITEKVDKIVLNKWLSIPIFILIMAAIYFLSVDIIGGLTVGLVDTFFNGTEGGIEIALLGNPIGVIPSEFEGIGPMLANAILDAGGSDWAASLVADGLIAGFGALCNFIPQLIILFACLSLLETIGYMSRITFLFDRFFKKIGMSGKSLVPFIVGAGCSVPGVMAARTVEDSKEHKLTVTLTPFIPCSAKLPIISLIAGSFFGSYGWIISLAMYLLAIAVIILSGWILNKLFIKNKSTSFINELPEYHLPSGSYIIKDVAEKTWEFIKRAGTIIVLCSIVVWFFSSFTWTFQYVDNETVLIDNSMLAGIGNAFAWFFYPMLGFNYSWGASVSAIQGLIAKEAVVSSMITIAHVGGEDAIFASTAFAFFNPITSFAFMTFNLFSAPCFGAIGAMRKEFGNSKDMWKAILFQTGFAWILASIIGMFGPLMG